jgi:anti-sigma regulatory factor (Ser/Thr protein kinase)
VGGSFDNLSFRLVIPSQTRYLNLVTNLAKKASLAAGLDDASAAKVSIAVDEAVTNIIVHAYKNDPEKTVEVSLHFSAGSMIVNLQHSGRGLRNAEVKLPDPNDYIKHPRKGGLGLLLMSRFMDEVHFSENGDIFECSMIKKLG